MTKWHYWLIALVFVVSFGVGALVQMLSSQTTSISIEPDVRPFTKLVSKPNSTPSPTPNPMVSLIFVGDMMFDRHVRVKQAGLGGYDKVLDPPLIALLNSADLTIGNLEGPITTNPSRSVGSAVGSPNNYSFTFDPAIVPALKTFGFGTVILGNNHILNQGYEGLTATEEYLRNGSISYIGDTGTETPSSILSDVALVGETLRVGLVNYNQFTPGSYERSLQILQEMENADDVTLGRSSDFQVVYTHWGNEYVPENQVLKNQAKAFVDAGADLIIGSHPHVVTGHELIEGRHVYYSLGNFIFDQYFEPAVMEGLVVEVTINTQTGEVTTKEHYVDIGKDGVTRLRTP